MAEFTEFPLFYGIRIGQKEGGIHAPDPDGGRYTNDKNTYLIKRDGEKPQYDIAEYLAGCIFSKTSPGSGAAMGLVKHGNGKTFLTSEFFNNYQDLFKTLGFKKRHEYYEAAKSWLPKTNPIKNELKKIKYQNYEPMTVTSLLVGDFSLHSGNIGRVDEEAKNPKLVRVDFGAAFRDFTPDINPYKSKANRIGLEKNYFLRDHPTRRVINKKFAAELRRVASIDLDQTIEEKWAEIEKFYSEQDIKKFGAQINTPLTASEDSLTVEQIKQHFIQGMKLRQQSLNNMALEIDIQIALKAKDRNVLLGAIKKAIKEDPAYCSRIIENPKKTQLGSKYAYPAPALIMLKTELRKHEKLPDKLQHDYLVIRPAAPLLLGNTNDSLSSNQSDMLDPVEMIRKEVISAQKNIHGNDIKTVLNANSAKQNLLFTTAKNGYQEFHTKFQGTLKPVIKDKPFENNRSNIICGDCKIIENSSTEPLIFKASNNSLTVVKKHRTIEFPLKLKDNSGPMDILMAAKNEHGQFINKKNAVYFTAHYNKVGELIEISSPQPIKFMGKDDKAVGYIEKEGRIYTLPITQGLYKQLCKQVSQNKGSFVDVSQIMEPVSKPLIEQLLSVKQKLDTKKGMTKSNNKQQLNVLHHTPSHY